MKIAHLSDLHLGVEDKSQNAGKTRLLLERAWQRGVDHLIVSGDISHNATSVDFEVFRELLEEYEFWDWKRVSLAIGNHDIFGGVHCAGDFVKFPGRCRATDYQKRVHVFVDCFQEAFACTERPLAPSSFPYAKVLEDLVLIGVNSIAPYSAVKNPFAANGRIAPVEIEQMRGLLQHPGYRGKRKLVIMHHHFLAPIGRRTRIETVWEFLCQPLNKIHDQNKLLELFAENKVELVLHGHIHMNAVYKINGIRFLNGGGAIEGNSAGELSINFISIEEDNIAIDMETLVGESAPQIGRYSPPVLVPEFAA